MKAILKAYAVAFIVFGVVDLAWISMVAAPMFKEALQGSLAPAVRIAPAIAFYLMYPAGLMFFAVVPAIRSGDRSTALLNGGLFGLFTYATYDLTNYATLSGWTLEITLMDIAYGAIVSACVAACALFIAGQSSGQAGRSR
jgi:uncharacterized membrane protein